MRFYSKNIFRMYMDLYLWSNWCWLIRPKHVIEL